jgi:hypothetical protein
VLAPLRVTALAGAYAALAEGVEGLGQNAAAAAVRTPYSNSWVDYDVSLGAYLPGAFGDSDFDNRGEPLTSQAFFVTGGGILQLGRFGVGVIADLQRFTLNRKSENDPPSASIEIARLHASAAYSFQGDQLVMGGGIRAVFTRMNTVTKGRSSDIFLEDTNVLTMIGAAPELGVLIKPDYVPYRIGATFRFPVSAKSTPNAAVTTDEEGVLRAGGLAVPDHVSWPWELEVGAALSAGPRPLNPKWIDPHEQEAGLRGEIDQSRRTRSRAQELEVEGIADPKEREERRLELERMEHYIRAEEDRRIERLSEQLLEERRARFKNWPRARILVTAEVLLTGSTARGVGLQSFLRQEDVASGNKVTYEPRLGIEGEPVPGFLVSRLGTYIEPSRYREPPTPGKVSTSRQHFTFGFDFRTFSWNVFGLAAPTEWRISFAGDIAPRYQNLGLSIGTWH